MAQNNRNLLSCSVRRQKTEIKVWEGLRSFERLPGESCPTSSAPGGSRRPLAGGCIAVISASIFTASSSPSLSLLRVSLLKILVLDLGPAQIIKDVSALDTSLHLHRPFFQIRSHSQVPGVRKWTYLMRRPPFNPSLSLLVFSQGTTVKVSNHFLIIFCIRFIKI